MPSPLQHFTVMFSIHRSPLPSITSCLSLRLNGPNNRPDQSRTTSPGSNSLNPALFPLRMSCCQHRVFAHLRRKYNNVPNSGEGNFHSTLNNKSNSSPNPYQKEQKSNDPIPFPFQRKRERFRMGLLDLEKHFAFYGAYHSNPVNVVIHILFVWPILFTALILLYFTPPLFSFPQTGLIHPVLVFNYGFLFTVLYALFYAALDIKAGSFAAVLTFLCWYASGFVATALGYSLAWKVVLAAQLFCWIGQFIGHGVFEKRAPALLDNLVQALLMAPFFVLFEVLQYTIGYEPYPGFNTRVKARIEADIEQWRDKKQKKLS